ncbi:MAG TPA: hypothetical protein DFK15_17970 [Butyricimonas sp.]|nr:hypothetical protein [Butyricimonas sp.]HCH91162.1 hypothetical protein [Butyricimonas sp.]
MLGLGRRHLPFWCYGLSRYGLPNC